MYTFSQHSGGRDGQVSMSSRQAWSIVSSKQDPVSFFLHFSDARQSQLLPFSAVYPDASALWSFPLHGSLFSPRNPGIVQFSPAMTPTLVFTCPDQRGTMPPREAQPVPEKLVPSLAFGQGMSSDMRCKIWSCWNKSIGF